MNLRKRRRLALEKSRKEAMNWERLWIQFPNATDYPGIDYRGYDPRVNQQGSIHYGVINMNALAYWAWEDIEADYGPPTCPKCGNEAVNIDDPRVPNLEEADDWEWNASERACLGCKYAFDSSEAYGDEPLSHILDDGEYKGQVDSDNDLFLVQSPYYTLAQFCLPCAPGAGHLENPCPFGVKTYCLGPEWFEDHAAPYPIWHIANGRLLKIKKH